MVGIGRKGEEAREEERKLEWSEGMSDLEIEGEKEGENSGNEVSE